MVQMFEQFGALYMHNHSEKQQGFKPCTSQQTRGVETMLFERWATVYDAVPTLKQHRFNASCLLGSRLQAYG